MSVLFLDNDDHRIQKVRETVPNVNIVRTAKACIKALDVGISWDAVYLEQDLVDHKTMDILDPLSGMEVVRWIAENKPVVGRFIIHTLNLTAATEMSAGLSAAGYPSSPLQFDSRSFDESLIKYLRRQANRQSEEL